MAVKNLRKLIDKKFDLQKEFINLKTKNFYDGNRTFEKIQEDRKKESETYKKFMFYNGLLKVLK